MSNAWTTRLHTAFVGALDGRVSAAGDVRRKPLDLDLVPPLPGRVRLYMYSLVAGGPTRAREYKAILRVPGQERGEYGSFEHADGRLTLLVAHRSDLDVFVLWDATLHRTFKWAGNIQVHSDTVLDAAATGWAEQRRPLTSGVDEVVLACTSRHLPRAIERRVAWTGGIRG
jgi:hypothetical protein